MESEELKNELSARISTLKKQTIFFLAITLLSALLAIYLGTNLKKSNRNLESARDSLQTTKDSIASVSDYWRTELVRVNQECQNSLDNISQKTTDPIPVYDPGISYVEQVYKSENKIKVIPKLEDETVAILPSPPSVIVKDSFITRLPIKRTRILLPKGSYSRNYLGYIVYIQDQKGSLVSRKVQSILKEKGFSVPSIEHMNEIRQTGILYFHAEDRQIAESIREILVNSIDKSENFEAKNFQVIQRTSKKPVPKGQLEIWIKDAVR